MKWYDGILMGHLCVQNVVFTCCLLTTLDGTTLGDKAPFMFFCKCNFIKLFRIEQRPHTVTVSYSRWGRSLLMMTNMEYGIALNQSITLVSHSWCVPSLWCCGGLWQPGISTSYLSTYRRDPAPFLVILS